MIMHINEVYNEPQDDHQNDSQKEIVRTTLSIPRYELTKAKIMAIVTKSTLSLHTRRALRFYEKHLKEDQLK